MPGPYYCHRGCGEWHSSFGTVVAHQEKEKRKKKEHKPISRWSARIAAWKAILNRLFGAPEEDDL